MLVDRALPIALDGESGDLSAFSVLDDLADRARVAFIGEMDHFIAEKYEYRLLCIRYLVSRGWRLFGEELAADRGRRVDEYLRTGNEDLLDPIDESPWFTSGILVNNRQPTDALDDAQKRFMIRVRRAVGTAAATPPPTIRWFGFDADSTNGDYLAAANQADSYEALRPAMAIRERIMHAHLARILAESPGEKIALMAAAAHLLKDDDAVRMPGVGAGPGGALVPSLGHVTANELADGPVLSFWLLHGEGSSANPWLPPPGRLKPAPGTFDEELLARFDRPVLVPVGDDDGLRAVTQMHNIVLHCRFAEQVDAIVFAPEVHPL